MIVVKPGHRVVFHPGELEPIALGGVGLGDEVAKRIVDDLVEDHGRRDVGIERPDLVAQIPRRRAAGVGSREELIDRQAVEVTHRQGARAVEVGIGIVVGRLAVKHRPGLRAAVVDADAAAQGVVGIRRRHRAVDLDVGQPVFIIVRVRRRPAPGGRRDHIAVIVVRVSDARRVGQLVAGSGRVPGRVRVAVGIVRVGDVAGSRRAGQLVVGIVRVRIIGAGNAA